MTIWKGSTDLKIGLSLPINYLIGNVSNNENMWWQEIYGSVSECLRSLKELGVTSVEINKICAKTPPIQLRHAVEAIRNAGLGVTVHGWLPKMEAESCIPLGILELEKPLIEHEQQGIIPFTVHSHESNMHTCERQILEQTLHDLNLLARASAKNSVFILALELCRLKERQSVGTTFAEVLFVAKQIGFRNLGLCWDVGHSQANYHGEKDCRLPGEEFVKNVIHTHIHDIGPDGRTHGPVLADQGYVKDCIDILKNSGYNGIYNLELSPILWGVSPGECRSYIESSINSITRMLINY
jgi:sugar phosphate isomerase/epimerase